MYNYNVMFQITPLLCLSMVTAPFENFHTGLVLAENGEIYKKMYITRFYPTKMNPDKDIRLVKIALASTE